jgi:hypothetical protein
MLSLVEGKVRIEKRCLCGQVLITGPISKAEADELGRKWDTAHSGPGHRKLSESAYQKLCADPPKPDPHSEK